MDIEINCNFIAIGRTKTGKTHTFTYLFKKIAHKFDYGICISSTAELNNDYDFLPLEYIHTEYDEEIIRKIMDIQMNDIKKIGKENKELLGKKAFIILDDQLGLINFHHSIFNELFSKSRHLNITVYVMIQHIKALSPVMRINSIYVMITVISDSSVDNCYDLVSGFNSKRDFKKFLNKYCVNYQAIIFDYSNPYEKNNIKVIKAPKNIKPFKLQY